MSYPIPGDLPQWDLNETNVTAPTDELADGWDPDALPAADHDNWFKWLASKVVRHLGFARLLASDFGPDQALGGYGSAPSTGSGLGPVAAGDFSARCWADGKAAGLTDSPAHTYADDSDTYWDLSREGVWTAAVVGTGDPEPAVTANSVRVFMVATVSGDRDSVTDLRGSHLKLDRLLDLLKEIRLGEGLRGSAADYLRSRVTALFSSTGTERMLLCQLQAANYPDQLASGNHAIRVYLKGAGADPEIEFVDGASWNNGTSQWDADPKTAPTTIQMRRVRLNLAEGLSVETVDSDMVGTSFADSGWTGQQLDTGQTRLARVQGGIDAGLSSYTQRETVEVPRYSGRTGGGFIRQLFASADTTQWYMLTGSTTGLDGAERGGEWSCNAKYLWNGSAFKWARTYAGSDAYLLQRSEKGVRLYRRSAALADAWDNSVDAANGWTLTDEIGSVTKTLLSSFGPATVIWPHDHADVDRGAGSGGTLANMPYGVRKVAGSTTADFARLLRLPQGATINSCSLTFVSSTGSASSGDCRAALVRVSSAGVRQSLNSGGYSDIPNSATSEDRALTVDQYAVVDSEAYQYFAWIWANTAVALHATKIALNYTVVGALGAWR